MQRIWKKLFLCAAVCLLVCICFLPLIIQQYKHHRQDYSFSYNFSKNNSSIVTDENDDNFVTKYHDLFSSDNVDDNDEANQKFAEDFNTLSSKEISIDFLFNFIYFSNFVNGYSFLEYDHINNIDIRTDKHNHEQKYDIFVNIYLKHKYQEFSKELRICIYNAVPHAKKLFNKDELSTRPAFTMQNIDIPQNSYTYIWGPAEGIDYDQWMRNDILILELITKTNFWTATTIPYNATQVYNFLSINSFIYQNIDLFNYN